MTGTYPMNVDSKARITLPSTFRKEVGKTIKLVPFKERVFGFTPEGFDAWVDGILDHNGAGYNPRSRRDERLRLGLNASAVEVDVDSAGRIALGKVDVARPGKREELGLTREVMVVGNKDHFEVWNAARWAAEYECFEADLEDLMYDD